MVGAGTLITNIDLENIHMFFLYKENQYIHLLLNHVFVKI